LIPLPAIRQTALEALSHTFIGILSAAWLRPDILHIHGIGPALLAPMAKSLGLKVVVTTHGPEYRRMKWGRFAKFVLKLGEYTGVHAANAVIAISDEIAARIKDSYGKTVVVIPNGVHLASEVSGKSTLFAFHLKPRQYILSVGRLVPEKGFDLLIQAFQRMRPRGWKLVIAGAADHESRYSRSLMRSTSGDGSIVMTGRLGEQPLAELYRQAGLFVLSSSYEGLPIALLEAMKSGAPCLASDIAGNRAVHLPDERYFPCGDVSALEARIKRFISEPFVQEDKDRQIRYVEEHFSWEQIARRTMGVYAECAGKQFWPAPIDCR
jgi:glycosyltransferase involved in cell wall biosynthesis